MPAFMCSPVSLCSYPWTKLFLPGYKAPNKIGFIVLLPSLQKVVERFVCFFAFPSTKCFNNLRLKVGTKIIISACATPILVQIVKLADDPDKQGLNQGRNYIQGVWLEQRQCHFVENFPFGQTLRALL